MSKIDFKYEIGEKVCVDCEGRHYPRDHAIISFRDARHWGDDILPCYRIAFPKRGTTDTGWWTEDVIHKVKGRKWGHTPKGKPYNWAIPHINMESE